MTGVQTCALPIWHDGLVESFVIEGGCTSPLAVCEVTLADMHDDIDVTPSDRDPILIDAGLEDDPARLFDGSVRRVYRSLDQRIVLNGLCRARQLADKLVTTTYQNERADAIVRHLVAPFSFASRAIAECPVIVDKLPLCGHSVIECLRLLNRATDGRKAFYCRPDGSFVWGEFDPEQAVGASFTLGEDVIDYRQLSPGRWLIDVFGTPIWHSTIISIEDESGNVTHHCVEAFKHSIGKPEGAGFRTRLWIRQLEVA